MAMTASIKRTNLKINLRDRNPLILRLRFRSSDCAPPPRRLLHLNVGAISGQSMQLECVNDR